MTTVFLDTETLGLDRAAPIWEFAAIRVDDAGMEVAREHFTIEHDPGDWPDALPKFFREDYLRRYSPGLAVPRVLAVRRIADIVDGGAVIAGSNSAFDMERLTDLLAEYLYTPGWHYHPLDVPTLALGWLAARGELIARPWKSDAISRAAGVDPAHYQRHTAMGDVLWSKDLYSVVSGGVW